MRRLSFASAVVALAVAASAATARAQDATGAPVVGSPAPNFSLTTLAGKTISLASLRGKVVVINVWATWCPPCREEMPGLMRAAGALRESGVVLLGVDTTEEAPIVRAYVAARNVTYPQAIDSSKTFATAYDVAEFPTTFVIDANGILRARAVDEVSPKELAGLIADARVGRNGTIVSPLQAKVDATLAESNFTFGGTRADVVANAVAIDKAIAAADALVGESDAASGNPVDYVRTRAEEAAIRNRAIVSLLTNPAPSPSASGIVEPSPLAKMQGDDALAREQWQPALDFYATALANDAKNQDVLQGIALAAARLGQYDRVVDADRKLAALEPLSTSDLIDLARAQQSAGNVQAAYDTFDRAVGIAQVELDAHPTNATAIRALAGVRLYFGRAYAKAGDASHARAQFEMLSRLATRLPKTNPRHDMYLEEAQEAIVALTLGNTHADATLSIAPWTGPVLPGSSADTIKYRVIVTGGAGKTVALKATDVPKGWIASFCSDLICSPFRVNVAVPESGVKIVEFQLVPPSKKALAPKVRITSTGGGESSSSVST